MLGEAEGLTLARYARAVIREALGGAPAVAPAGNGHEGLSATFVTLHRGDELHGCVGTIEPRRALPADVRGHALAAAFEDPRGGPLVLTDVDALTVEVSLLSVPERVLAGDATAAARVLRPGIDGVVFSAGERRSTYLPQVWEDFPDPVEFLRRLRRKAGVAADFWSSDVVILRYQVQKWTDAAIAAPAATVAPAATSAPVAHRRLLP